MDASDPRVGGDGNGLAWQQSLNGALIDPETGFLTRKAWDQLLSHEEHRFARYRRPVTALVFELDGMDALAARLGHGPAGRLIVPVAKVMQSNVRASDVIARVGYTRFVAVLPETDEIAAINYIDRVRSACDIWLAAGAVAVRLAIGWAQPPVGGTLADALRVAHVRLDRDRRRQGGPAQAGADQGPEGERTAGAGASNAANNTRTPSTVRSQDFENLLADFLEHPGAPGTTASPGDAVDDSDI